MKYLCGILIFVIIFSSCGSSHTNNNENLNITNAEKEAFNSQKGEPVKIANDSVEYEIIIIDPGFYTWLNSIAMSRGYYSQQFMENRNQIYVINWNQRVLNPSRYNPNLYEMQINYDPDIDYGYEVNYQLYNYFLYFQRKYNQRLGPFFPRLN
ncbi:DUF6146 family protein [Abyssalbus ytuae]|uniref:DUF6146 family protein n=1 Tax=Abyssalbus ytuae TaxID=2926907 RepID=A0A9E6ZY81_9FLAO|nr:DUF6146 family protein [Abyssalbus ytuae]UOB17392.1 DUF6146 family protein [Abyssalbus ytuae]